MRVIVIIVAVVAVAALVAWMLLGRHPEQAASHGAPDQVGTDRFYGNATDRPAGPDAEAMRVVDDGELTTAPNEPIDPPTVS